MTSMAYVNTFERYQIIISLFQTLGKILYDKNYITKFLVCQMEHAHNMLWVRHPNNLIEGFQEGEENILLLPFFPS